MPTMTDKAWLYKALWLINQMSQKKSVADYLVGGQHNRQQYNQSREMYFEKSEHLGLPLAE